MSQEMRFRAGVAEADGELTGEWTSLEEAREALSKAKKRSFRIGTYELEGRVWHTVMEKIVWPDGEEQEKDAFASYLPCATTEQLREQILEKWRDDFWLGAHAPDGRLMTPEEVRDHLIESLPE
ncbi:MAG: hypothetical protein AAGN46_04560 [Acidobacteriota bacterium]